MNSQLNSSYTSFGSDKTLNYFRNKYNNKSSEEQTNNYKIKENIISFVKEKNDIGNTRKKGTIKQIVLPQKEESLTMVNLKVYLEEYKIDTMYFAKKDYMSYFKNEYKKDDKSNNVNEKSDNYVNTKQSSYNEYDDVIVL